MCVFPSDRPNDYVLHIQRSGVRIKPEMKNNLKGFVTQLTGQGQWKGACRVCAFSFVILYDEYDISDVRPDDCSREVV